MSEAKPPPPPKPPADDREARLAKALRDNLRRRKAAVQPRPRPSEEG
jgi:hypothetical protein